MIEIQGLTKKYGEKSAIVDLSFSVNDNEILGFLGPNGAGKTTTMSIITGYIPANEGTVTVGGFDIAQEPKAAKKQMGYLPEVPPLYTDMTVTGYLTFAAELKLVGKVERKAEVGRVMELVGVSDVANRLIKNLSKGYQQRVGLAQALLGDPPILVLDEPTVGLDPKQIIEIRELIKSLGERHTVILSSHILSEVSAICDRVIIINKGRIVAVDTPDNLSKIFAQSTKITATIEGQQEIVTNAIMGIDSVTRVQVVQENQDGSAVYNIEAESGDVRKELFLAMSSISSPIIELKTVNASLEDVFIQLTADDGGISDDSDI